MQRFGCWQRWAAVVFVACLSLSIPPAPAKERDEKVEERAITGEIVTVSKHAVSIEYAKTKTASEEMLLPLDEKVRVEGPKRLTELKPGDRVSVTYRQTYREKEDGQRVILNTVATKVALLRSATGEGTLRSEAATVSE